MTLADLTPNVDPELVVTVFRVALEFQGKIAVAFGSGAVVICRYISSTTGDLPVGSFCVGVCFHADSE